MESGGPGMLTLEVIATGMSPPCDSGLRILLSAPGVPSNVNTVTVYPVTICESAHPAYLTRTFYEGLTGHSDGFGGEFHYERDVSACTATGACTVPMPFLYNPFTDPSRQVTVDFREYGYDLSESTTLP
jgi:hypothetical protein